jgi:hypothetical protein
MSEKNFFISISILMYRCDMLNDEVCSGLYNGDLQYDFSH